MSYLLTAPPTYCALAFSYKPILPSSNRRYNRERTIDHPAGPLREGWDECVHPEGDTYWYQTERGLLTCLDPRDARINDCLTKASEDILGLHSDRSNMEIFIDLDFSDLPQSSSVTVLYYMIDHRSRQIFWNSDVNFIDIGITPCLSRGHLKSFLTPEYWLHVDYFPTHMSFDKNLSDGEEELMAILGHGAVDDKTAPGSTCLWGASECIQYLTVLRDFRSRARHANSYGLPNARLDRLQGLVDYTTSQCGFKTALCSLAILWISIIILQDIPVFLDRHVVYDQRWDIFSQDLPSAWLKTFSPFTAVVLCLIVTFFAFR
ncbi:hypothetical protein M407DRAFT_8832 [Tulasnella calospora MUT 4182]|uniref:WW domain-containing protein n=1 Tax=Tulasnella calospora MUT 4182 TaxID=1051891 RepID=A0A0C3QF23_9AGAM|nr:hypothetical protein M407DRAFT_8832 [Tulasnella calospora MUT 4182]